MVHWKGILAATITPFKTDGSVDFNTLSAHVRRLATAGCRGIVVNAVTGEGGSLTPGERADAVRCTREAVAQDVCVIATVGSVSDIENVSDIRSAEAAGADGIMLITPFFYRLSTAERVDHFVRLGKVCELPYIIYNTTYASPMLSVDELVAVAEKSDRFVGLKEGNHGQASESARRLGSRIGVYTSRDTHINELGFAGGAGAVTYSSNIVPELTVALWNAVEARDHVKALELQRMLNPIAMKLVSRSFPSPVKAAMKIMTWDRGFLRTPLSELGSTEIENLREMLVGYYPELADVA